MAAQRQNSSFTNPISDAIATTTQVATFATQLATQATQSAADTITAVGEAVRPAAVRFVEPGTETVGKIVAPIAEHPLTKYAAKVPGISLLVAALGQVDLEQAQKDVDKLRQDSL